MRSQHHISERNRAQLINWLVDMQLGFGMVDETLHLAVNIVDRFLSATMPVSRDKLQLMGAAAILIASKYEDRYAATVYDLADQLPGVYATRDIADMERQMMRALNFNFTVPSSLRFTGRFVEVVGRSVDLQFGNMVNYVAELRLQEAHMIKHPPSLVAASAVYVALKLMPGRHDGHDSCCWSPTMQRYTRYSEAALQACSQELYTLLTAASSDGDDSSGGGGGLPRLRAVRRKYTAPGYGGVASSSRVGRLGTWHQLMAEADKAARLRVAQRKRQQFLDRQARRCSNE
jgi:hypothetical protein